MGVKPADQQDDHNRIAGIGDCLSVKYNLRIYHSFKFKLYLLIRNS